MLIWVLRSSPECLWTISPAGGFLLTQRIQLPEGAAEDRCLAVSDDGQGQYQALRGGHARWCALMVCLHM